MPSEATQDKPVKPSYKLFSKNSIIFGSFLGGPLALIYFLYRNYQNLQLKKHARRTLIIGIISSLAYLALFVFIDHIFSTSVPHYVTGGIILGVASGLYEKFQREHVDRHKSSGGEFYSGWRVVVIVLVSIALVLAPIIGYIHYYSQTNNIGINDTLQTAFGDYDVDTFTRLEIQISENDEQALKVYDLVYNASSEDYIRALDTGLEKFNQNLKLAADIQNIPNLPNVLIDRAKTIIEYTNLRIREFELRKKEEIEQTNNHTSELDEISRKIEAILSER